MHPIEIINISRTQETRYVVPHLVTYKEQGVVKNWEVIKSHDSVAILIYKADSQEFVLVKQFRPAVFLHNGDGYTVELCAGLMDKDVSPVQTACEEILEETGFSVDVQNIEEITTFYTSVGFSGASQTLFFATVDETMRKEFGGGVVGEEHIEVIYLPLEEAKSFIYDVSVAKTLGLMFAFLWFFERYP